MSTTKSQTRQTTSPQNRQHAQQGQQHACGHGGAIQRTVKDNAVESALVMFGLGVGAGLVIASLISEPKRSKSSAIAHQLGEHMMNSFHAAWPDSLFKR